MSMTLPEYLLIPEIARTCRVPPATVRHWLRTGRLASTKPGRRRLVLRDDFERFLAVHSGP
jgi:excisionase family DNA binding protein